MFKVEISAEEARKIRNGQEITLNDLCSLKNYDISYVIVGNVPIAICNFIYGSVKPIRVFNICYYEVLDVDNIRKEKELNWFVCN